MTTLDSSRPIFSATVISDGHPTLLDRQVGEKRWVTTTEVDVKNGRLMR